MKRPEGKQNVFVNVNQQLQPTSNTKHWLNGVPTDPNSQTLTKVNAGKTAEPDCRD